MISSNLFSLYYLYEKGERPMKQKLLITIALLSLLAVSLGSAAADAIPTQNTSVVSAQSADVDPLWRTNTTTPIKHVVVIFQENVSFDIISLLIHTLPILPVSRVSRPRPILLPSMD
jgi:hypothetical protein